ncbi:MAG: ATP-binding cassette domain-containing protein [Spirochaetales bacterium]|nr:ATP-binding cassette domain-containing protein [Spirochaetales bacterium]
MQIKISDLRFFHKNKGDAVLNLKNLAIELGSITAVVGDNGSGKTTLLKLLAGLYPCSEGKIEFPTDFALSDIAFLHQDPFLFHSSLYNNVALPLRILGRRAYSARVGKRLSRREFSAVIDAQVDSALAKSGLLELKHRKSPCVSGGERKRAAIARNLLASAKIFIFDEPDSGIDAKSRQIISQLFLDLKASGYTVIFSSHSPKFYLPIVDKVVQLENGQKMNFEYNILNGEVVKRGDGLSVFSNSKAEIRLLDYDGSFKRVVIRYEDIFLSKKEVDSTARNQLRGVIIDVEEHGNYHKVTIDAGFVLSTLVTADGFSQLGLSLGQEVFAVFKATAVKPY